MLAVPAVRSWSDTLRAVLRQSAADGPATPGWLTVPRLLALTALTAAWVAQRPDDALVWLVGGVLLVATAVEPVLRRLLPVPAAVQLPGWTPPTVAVARFVVPAALVALLLVLVAAAGALTPWVFGVAAVVQGVPLLLATAQALRAYAARPAAAAALGRAVAQVAPEFVLYTARRGGAYQLQMWLPHLEALGRPFLVVTRDPAALAPLAEVTTAPVVACPTWRDLDRVVVPSLRAAFYVNSVAANADFVTYRQLTHVYLGHGESDKALSHHPAHAMYDLVFVAGQAAVERYARHGVQVPADKFVVVGNPQSAAVEPVDTVAGSSDGRPAGAVLYAPTWQGYNDDSSYSSLSHGVQVVRALLELPGPVVFRPHPFSRTRATERGHVAAVEELLAADARATGRAHVYGVDEPFAGSANRVVAMVGDLSSVVTEFLASGKPLALVTDGEPDFATRNPVARAAYLVAPDLAELPAVLARMLGDDPLREERVAVRRHYVGAEGDQAFARAVLSLLDAPRGADSRSRHSR
ncbi:hypothetical protein ASC58_05730 [Phycicoccus sp. Root101]|nr:hypothetical protein ASC58_05730 [Phycicoccus sp. Root101]